MATGGEVQGQCPDRSGSEDLDQLKCQPCLEDGNLREAVGMCIDCQDCLCLECFKGHTLPKPMRKHRLLDREQMIQGHILPTVKDACTEQCSDHEEKLVEYYCLDHNRLGCTACMTLDHKLCKGVQYIPHVAKELANNSEYRQIESELKAALETFNKVFENTKQNEEELNTSCSTALESVKAYRKRVDAVFDNMEAKLIERALQIKTKEINELQAISDKYKQAEEELQASMDKIEALQSAKQNCSSYIEMIRTKDKLKSLDTKIKEVDVDKTYTRRQIQFLPNPAIQHALKEPDALGIISGSDTGPVAGRYGGEITGATHAKDVNVKIGNDTQTCCIQGFTVLPNNRLIVTDYNNMAIKSVSVEDGRFKTKLQLSSQPWDICAISNDKVAVALPNKKKIAFVSVGGNDLKIDRTLNVDGTCCGIDYRNDKLAVSYLNPHKVQILNLQGTLLHTIATDKQGKSLFNYPFYLTYGQDDTTLYVSNNSGHNVTCVKLDGTVVATYTDNGLRYPLQPVVDSQGNVYVCADNPHPVHQISKDCKKLRTLLYPSDGLNIPYSICLSEKTDLLYVGNQSDNVKVYKLTRSMQ